MSALRVPLSLLALLHSSGALALQPPWDSGLGYIDDCYTYNSLETPYDDLAAQAQITNTRVFGAVGTLEREVLHYMREKGPFMIGLYDNRAILGAVRVPGVLIGKCKHRLSDVPLDVMSNTLSVGVRLGPGWTLFYSGATTTTWGFVGPTWRALSLLDGPFFNGINVATAPIIGAGSYTRDANGYTIDYLAGIEGNSKMGTIRAGYLGSKGLYAGGSLKKAFITSALTDGLENLSFLNAGLDGLDWLPKKYGLSRIALRKLQFQVGPDAPVVQPHASGKALAYPTPTVRETLENLWTGEIQQRDLLGRYDLDLGARISPFSLHHAFAGMHSEGYNPRKTADALKQELRWSVRAGAFYAQDQHYFGVEGGVRAHVEAELCKAFDRDGEAAASVAFRLNDPDTLDLFPTAVNAMEFMADFRLVSW